MTDNPGATAPPAAWYPDPSNPTLQRYWDGEAWTDHTAPVSAPKTGMSTGAKVAIGVGIGLVALIVMGLIAAVAIPASLQQRRATEDAAAKADVASLGKEIATYYVTNSGPPPRIAATDGQYWIETNSGIITVRQSANVRLEGVTGTGARDWCVWVTNPEGDKARAGYRFTAVDGLEPGSC